MYEIWHTDLIHKNNIQGQLSQSHLCIQTFILVTIVPNQNTFYCQNCRPRVKLKPKLLVKQSQSLTLKTKSCYTRYVRYCIFNINQLEPKLKLYLGQSLTFLRVLITVEGGLYPMLGCIVQTQHRAKIGNQRMVESKVFLSPCRPKSLHLQYF